MLPIFFKTVRYSLVIVSVLNFYPLFDANILNDKISRLALYNNLIFFMFIRFPAILLVKTIDSYFHEFCARGILHSDFQ